MILNRRQILGLVLCFLVVLAFFTPQARSYYSLQERQRLAVGDSLELLLNLPPSVLKKINVYVKEGEKLLSFEGNLLTHNKYSLGVNSPLLVKPGQLRLQLKLFGVIPLKNINVDVLPEIELVAGGHSIGVLLRTEGIMVVGFSPVLNAANEPVFPARESDICIGDVIVAINDTNMITDDQVKQVIAGLGSETVKIKLKREGQIIERYVNPEYCQDTKSYRIGLFVRDNAGGVGTLTFYEPSSGTFGALGHMIADGETNQKITLRQGKIMYASVEDIQKAQKGIPGEKVGIFVEESDLGEIAKNENCGIYGTTNKEILNPIYPEKFPIEYSNKIHTGEAEIMTVLKGQDIKRYTISVEKVLNNYSRKDGKNMIIRITDAELLHKTGGIIQGMSGSPIIQDGKIIGAVTHVFVNDPTRGYGVFIENMLMEAGIIKDETKTLGFNTRVLHYEIFDENNRKKKRIVLLLDIESCPCE